MGERMRNILIAFAVILTDPAGATTWSNRGCTEGIVSEGYEFLYMNQKGASIRCKLITAQELTCDDGQKRRLVSLPDNEVMVDDVRMYVVGAANPSICE